jgi:hypothetical protein
MGGLTGAIMASSRPSLREPAATRDPDSPFPYRLDVFEEDQPLISPVLLYWLLVALTVVATILGTCLYSGRNDPWDLVAGLFLAILVLPGLQLVASLLAVIIIALFYPEPSTALRRVGKITLWSFGGTSLGLVLMGTCLGAIYFWPKR